MTAQRLDSTGQDLRFDWRGKAYQKRLELIGDFQADNVLLACGLVIACGAEPSEVFDTIPHLTTVRGRMELAATRDNGAAVFVDYSHTPDAVEPALRAMRLVTGQDRFENDPSFIAKRRGFAARPLPLMIWRAGLARRWRPVCEPRGNHRADRGQGRRCHR